MKIFRFFLPIFLSHNEIKKIDGLFQYLESPDFIDISDNKIKVIKKTTFRNALI
jgi:hypothetical protein